MKRLIREIRVSRSLPAIAKSSGFALVGGVRIPCVLGRSGVVSHKREGDGGTPRGVFRVLGGYFRADRTRRPRSVVPLRPTRSDDGWCDDPNSFSYNRPVRLPTAVRCERMTLPDPVYDIVLPTSYNVAPRKLGAGSAIFIHLRRADGDATEGCVAFSADDMRRLLPRLSRNVRILVR